MKNKLVKSTKFWLIVSVIGSFTTTAALVVAERKADRAEKKAIQLEQDLQIKTEEISFTNSSFHEGLIDFIENLGTNYNPIFHSRIVREIGNKQNKEIHFALIKKGGNPISIFFIVYNSKNNK